jgi:hypothetical protein
MKLRAKRTSSSLLLFVFTFLFFGVGLSFAFEHPQYDIAARLDASQKTIAAEQTVTFTNNSQNEINKLHFYIYPNRVYTEKEKKFVMRFAGYFKTDFFPEGFQAGRVDMQSLRSGEADLAYKIDGKDQSLLTVDLPDALAPGETITVQMTYSVFIPRSLGRFGWNENMFRLSRWYPQLAVHNDEGWQINPFYPFHRPFYSEASLYKVKLTVPKEQVVIHSGSAISEEEEGEYKVIVTESRQPIREYTFATSPEYLLVEGSYKDVKIKSYYLPGNEVRAKEALRNVKDAFAFYSDLFGEYPYEVFSIAPVQLGYGGEQNSNLIYIDTRVYELPGFLSRYFDFMVAHETGHQWLYNVVGIDAFKEMWLEEGLNSYFMQEYLEHKYGEYASVFEFPAWFKDWEWLLPPLTFYRTRDFRYKTLARIGMDHAIISKLESFREPSSIFSITYGKGARVVGMLRHYLGEQAFSKVLQRLYAEYTFKNLSIEEFIGICEQEAGGELDWFFDPWLFGDQQFDYAVKKVSDGKIEIENRGGIDIPVDVKVNYADGTTEQFRWDKSKDANPIAVKIEKKIKSVRLDPEQELLDLDQTNNSWPRKVSFIPVPFYFGLYDVALFVPEDSYNVVVGPEAVGSRLGIKASIQKPYDQIFYGATGYEFGDELHKSRVGYQFNNVLGKQAALGFQIANVKDYEDGTEDLASGRIYYRRELWPAKYGLVDINDHFTLYLLRNRRLNDGIEFATMRERTSHMEYARRNESIVGLAFDLNRAGPYPDPHEGYKLHTLFESAGHFLGSEQYFNRGTLETTHYQFVTRRSKLAIRMQAGTGYPKDKDLFQLGGINSLRGYNRKEFRGSNLLMGSLEYRFPILKKLRLRDPDHLFHLEGIDGVAFFDAGQVWYGEFSESSLKKDAGFGLRFKVNIASFIEKLVVRFDVAEPINDSKEDTKFWFGVNHTF